MEFLKVGVMCFLLVMARATTVVLCYDVSFAYYPTDLGFGYCSTFCSIAQNCTGNEGCQISSATKDPALVLIPFGTGNNRDIAVRYMRDVKVQLWDSITGVTASLSTFFVIRLSQVSGYATGDGLTFLIAPDPLTPANSQGGNLGLFQSDNDGFPLNGDSRIVALKFDTHNNTKYNDPPAPYLGLDINSLVSSVYTHLGENVLGQVDFLNNKFGVWMEYNGTRHIAEVSILLWPEGGGFGAARNLRPHATHVFTYSFDLKSSVEEYSYVGFSAGTGHDFEINEVFYWEFETTGLGAAPNYKSPSGLSRALKLALLIAAGLLLALLLLCCCLCCLWRRRRRKRKQAQAVLPSALLGDALMGAGRKDDRLGALTIAMFNAPNQEKGKKKRQAGVVRALKHAHKPPSERAPRATNNSKKHGAQRPPAHGDKVVRTTNKMHDALKPPIAVKETKLVVTKKEKLESHRFPGASGERRMRDIKMHKSRERTPNLRDTTLGKKHGLHRPENSSSHAEPVVTSYLKATRDTHKAQGATGERASRETKLLKSGAQNAPAKLASTTVVTTGMEMGMSSVAKNGLEDLQPYVFPVSSMPKHASTSGTANPQKDATPRPLAKSALTPSFPRTSAPISSPEPPRRGHSTHLTSSSASSTSPASSSTPASHIVAEGPPKVSSSTTSSSSGTTYSIAQGSHTSAPQLPLHKFSPLHLAPEPSSPGAPIHARPSQTNPTTHGPSTRLLSVHAPSMCLPPPSDAQILHQVPHAPSTPYVVPSHPKAASHGSSSELLSAHRVHKSPPLPSNAQSTYQDPVPRAPSARLPSIHAQSWSPPPPSDARSSHPNPVSYDPSTSFSYRSPPADEARSNAQSSHPNPMPYATSTRSSFAHVAPSNTQFLYPVPRAPSTRSPSTPAILRSTPPPLDMPSSHPNQAPAVRLVSEHSMSRFSPPTSDVESTIPSPSDFGRVSHTPPTRSGSTHATSRSPSPPFDVESPHPSLASHALATRFPSESIYAGSKSLPPSFLAGSSRSFTPPSGVGSSPSIPSHAFSAGLSVTHGATSMSPPSSNAEYPHPNPASHAHAPSTSSPLSHAGSESFPPPLYVAKSSRTPSPPLQGLVSQHTPLIGSSSAPVVSMSLPPSDNEFPHLNHALHGPSASVLAESKFLSLPSFTGSSRFPAPSETGPSHNLTSHSPSPSAGFSSLSRPPSPSEAESPHPSAISHAPSAHAESLSPPSHYGSSRSFPPPSDVPSTGSSVAHVVTMSSLSPLDAESSTYSNPSSHFSSLRSLPPHLDVGSAQVSTLYDPLVRPPSVDEVPRTPLSITTRVLGGPASNRARPSSRVDAQALSLSSTSIEAAPNTRPPPSVKAKLAPIHSVQWSSFAAKVELESLAPTLPTKLAHSSQHVEPMSPSTSTFASSHTLPVHRPHAKPSHSTSSEHPMQSSTHQEGNTPRATSSLPSKSAYSTPMFHNSPHGGQRPVSSSGPPSSAHSFPGVSGSPQAEFRPALAPAAPSIPSSYVLSALGVPSSSSVELRPLGHLVAHSSASSGHKETPQHAPKTEKFKKSISHHKGRHREGLVLGTTNKNKTNKDFLRKTRKTVLQLLGLQKKIVLTKPAIKYKHWIPPGPTT